MNSRTCKPFKAEEIASRVGAALMASSSPTATSRGVRLDVIAVALYYFF